METTSRPQLVLFVLSLELFAAATFLTAINLAIPSMASDLDVPLDDILWVINVYVLTFTALLFTAGRLGDVYGPKTLFLAGLAIFTAASVACGLADGVGQLIAARATQGVGAALTVPQALKIVTHVFPPDRRGRAWGITGAVGGLAAAAGPTIGGVLVELVGWRGIFFINVPLGVVSFLLAMLVLPNPRGERGQRLDLLGAAILITALSLITFGMIEGHPRDWGAVWGPVTIPMIMVVGVLMLVAFVLVERSRQGQQPLLPFAVLRDRNFSRMAFVAGALPCAVGAMLLLTPIFMQSAVGMTGPQTGLVIATAPLMSMFFAPYAGRLADRVGGRPITLAGLCAMVVGLAAMASATRAQAAWWHALPALLVFGVGMGVVFAPAATVAMRDIDERMSGAAAGVYSTSQRAGAILGGAAVGAILQSGLSVPLAQASPQNVAYATRIAFVLPVAVLLFAIVACLGVRERPVAGDGTASPVEPEPARPAAP